MYPEIKPGNISAIWFTIWLYLSYSSEVSDTFSPKLLTPLDNFSYSEARDSTVEAFSSADFLASLYFSIKLSTRSSISSAESVKASNAFDSPHAAVIAKPITVTKAPIGFVDIARFNLVITPVKTLPAVTAPVSAVVNPNIETICACVAPTIPIEVNCCFTVSTFNAFFATNAPLSAVSNPNVAATSANFSLVIALLEISCFCCSVVNNTLVFTIEVVATASTTSLAVTFLLLKIKSICAWFNSLEDNNKLACSLDNKDTAFLYVSIFSLFNPTTEKLIAFNLFAASPNWLIFEIVPGNCLNIVL